MDIWIILNGQKTGPIHDYEIRHKIEDGELTPDTPAWHEGLDAWKPLVEIDLFTREFEPKPPASAEPSIFTGSRNDDYPLPEPLLQNPLLARRFWARWLDLCLYSGIWWISLWATGCDIRSVISNFWVTLPHYIPWFVLEAFLIHHFGTTPGKWLLSLKVTNLDGSPLDLAAATRRSARVLFTGIGFGWGLLTIFCQVLSYFTTKRMGRPLWDHVGGHQLVFEPLKPLRMVVLVFLFITAFVLQLMVLLPYIWEDAAARSPEFKEQFEKIPIWHLPKRS